MPRRRIGQEEFGFTAAKSARSSSLEALAELIEWSAITPHLAGIHAVARGEPGWPPVALWSWSSPG